MSISSSNITKENTPIKKSLSNKLPIFEDIELIESVSSLIEDIIKRNMIKKKLSKKSVFFCEDSEIPDISIHNYIYFIYTYLNLEFSSILLSVISINRFLEINKDYLSKNNFYKLFIASCILNSKLNEEPLYFYDYYSKAGRIDKNELIILENEYFKMIDYKLFVNEDIYKRYYNFIKQRALKETKTYNSKK